jgi:threonine/homoserine/homoserine lactone efflux protein
MIEVSWLVFVALPSLVLIATPGQDMILVMSRSIVQGAAAGVATAAGVSVGLIGHTILATLGLGAILRTSEWLFIALKFVGAAYLLYLGIGLLLSKHDNLALPRVRQSHAAAPLHRRRVLEHHESEDRDLLFAFLPQFVSPSAAHPTLSIFVLGLVFAALTFLSRRRSVSLPARCPAGCARPAVLRWLFRSSGAILVGLSVRLALERRD